MDILDQKLLDKMFKNQEFLGLTNQQISDLIHIPVGKINHLKLQHDLSKIDCGGIVRDILNSQYVPEFARNFNTKKHDSVDTIIYYAKAKTKKVGLWHRSTTKIKTLVLNWFNDLNL